MKRVEITPELSDLSVRDAGDGPEHYNIRGHAAVFDRLSENLGGFVERIAPGAFTDVLNRTPDVRLLIDHNASSVMARTTNQTLELREDPMGLHVWARINRALPEAAGMRTRLETGLLSAMSFAFTIADESRAGETEDGTPIYEVRQAGDLYDVSVVTYPAYRQTDVGVVRMRMMPDPDAKALSINDVRRIEGLPPLDDDPEIARAMADQLSRRESSTAAEVPAAVVVPDRERERALRGLRAKARLLVVRYPLG